MPSVAEMVHCGMEKDQKGIREMTEIEKLNALIKEAQERYTHIEEQAKFLLASGVHAVVRCKDCKYWNPMDDGLSWRHKGRPDGECEVLFQIHRAERYLTEGEHFCSVGERKVDNG